MSDVINSQQGIDSEEITVRDMIVKVPESLTCKLGNRQPLSTDEVAFLERTREAARCNAPQIYSGIGAIGELLALSADEISKESIHAIGWHLNLLGHIAHALHDTTEACDSILEINQNK